MTTRLSLLILLLTCLVHGCSMVELMTPPVDYTSPQHDTTLKSLEVLEGTLSPAFTPLVTSYSAVVGSMTSNLTFGATATFETCRKAFLPDTYDDAGHLVVTIRVSNDAGDKTDYKITFFLSTEDSSLKSLTAAGLTLTPAFSPTTYSYAALVGNQISSVDLAAVANSATGTVEGTGTQSLSVGKNVFLIQGVDGRGGKTSYVAIITRSNAKAQLTSLSLGDIALQPPFTPEQHDYTALAAETNAGCTVTATSSSEGALVVGGGFKNLLYGQNDIHVTVTEKDGLTSTYNINVKRAIDLVGCVFDEWAFVWDRLGNLWSRSQATSSNKLYPMMSGVSDVYYFYDYPQSVTYVTKTDGTLWAFGGNSGGSLNSGSIDYNDHPIPVQIMSDIASVGFVRKDGEHRIRFYLKKDGTLLASGYNEHGQILGAPSQVYTPYLQAVPILSDVKSFITTLYSSFALKTDGSLWAFGVNYGQFGTGDSISRNIPVQVSTQVVSSQAVGSLLVYLKTDGTLWGCGGNFGTGDLLNRTSPYQISSSVTSYQLTGQNLYFLTSEGKLYATGDNSVGQLGTGDNQSILVPTMIMSHVKQFNSLVWTDVYFNSVSSFATFVVKDDNSLWSFGTNRWGELGTGDRIIRSVPSKIISDVDHVVARLTDSSKKVTVCSFMIDGTIKVWGMDMYSLLGLPTQTWPLSTPTTLYP